MGLEIRYADKCNWIDLINLSVKNNQSNFIESNLYSIAESKFEEAWKTVGIYNDDILIGFSMYGKLEDNRVWLDRFMIDHKFQGRGYGKLSLKFLIDSLYREYECEEIYLSIYEDNINAIELYKTYGFEFNGELDTKGEKVMVLDIKNHLKTY
ncbi:GNAT family N-acetyltransferase [Metaclostridioides mangenotii]|uniref:Diamine N-acetyltransferase n=1 Tax=Metaclostridioides mangenotii TaxID=1540 RepID=A0ABS4E9L9_9FIRM|nr:GNAT family N-acetyltransferase [Clostridioides mangenotii]MBP1854603.1 diamine N-acetyltransferase [Clostridioides mangenotii]